MSVSLKTLEIVRHIGRTPIFELSPEGGGRVWLKLEGNNPGGSAKDRAVWGMLAHAERRGLLKPETTLVESTSGNTGIALAMLGGALGLRVVLTMPETMSAERRAALAMFGAELVLTPGAEGMQGAVNAAADIVNERPGALMLGQFENPGNVWAHAVTTGPEICAALRGRSPAAFVAGVGTGGTLMGVSRALKNIYPETRIVAVEPASSPLLSQGKAGPHKIQGIGANFVPQLVDKGAIDRVITVPDEAAFETARGLARKEGLSVGISTGANVWAARSLARELASESGRDEIVVTLQVDRADRYLSVFL